MFDYEGSRSEFLKFLTEFGEEPAFIGRARAPQIALDALLQACESKRNEMLEWPKFHLSVLSHKIGSNWSRLSALLSAPEGVPMLEALHASLHTSKPVQDSWLTNDKTALLRFLESAARFNRHWRDYLDGLDLEPANKPRRDFNQFYPLEKACAFGENERVIEVFEPLQMLDHAYLHQCFPVLTLPRLA
jgi:hypothetical protein